MNDLDLKTRRIKILSKLAARADARGDRRKATEFVKQARSIWLSVEKVNHHSGMKLFDVGMETYQKELKKRKTGKNPMSKVLHILSKDDSGDYRVVVKSNDFKQNRIYHTPDFDDAWGTANHILKSDSGIKDGRAKWATDKAAKMKLAKNPTRFAKLTAKLKRRGARSPKALAAWIGRRKYGKRKFQAMALAGRRKKGRIIRGHFGKKKYRLAANTREYPKGLTPWIIYGVVGYFAYKFWINKAAQTLSK